MANVANSQVLLEVREVQAAAGTLGLSVVLSHLHPTTPSRPPRIMASHSRLAQGERRGYFFEVPYSHLNGRTVEPRVYHCNSFSMSVRTFASTRWKSSRPRPALASALTAGSAFAFLMAATTSF